MPMARTKTAPKTFRGRPEDLKPFLRQYERLAALHELDSREKCDAVGDYCSTRIKETIEGLRSFQQGQWDLLKTDIERVFDAESVTKRFTLPHLANLCRKFSSGREGPMRDLKQWKNYVQNFVRIAGALQAHDRISEDEYATYFWIGIPAAFREKLETRIRNKLPDHDISQPFPVEAIQTAAEALLHRDRFDKGRVIWDLEDEFDSDDESDFYDSEDEEFQIKFNKSLKKRGHSSEPKTKTKSALDLPPGLLGVSSRKREEASRRTPEKPRAKPAAQDEVESLIKQMSRLSVTDKVYGLLYYQARSLDPSVADCVPKPQLEREIAPPERTYRSNLANATEPRKGPPPVRFSDRPPFNQDRPPFNPDRSSFSGCFGCGQKGHTFNFCPRILEMIETGVIQRSNQGQLLTSTGQRIFRRQGETFIQALERIPLESHFIQLEEAEEVSEPETSAVWAAQYTPRISKPPSRPVFDGVQMPPRRPQAPRNAPPKNTQITPVDAIPSRFDPTKEDIVMEDVSNKPPPARKQPPQPKENQEKGDAVRNTARHSTLSEKVSSSRVIEHALETPVTVTMGQLLGSSKELTQSLMDMLRFKKPVEPAAVSTNLIHTTAPLLRLKMICNGFPVNFVIDSGSEVNLLNHEIAQDIGLPVDERPSVAIKDANGGLGRAVGMIPNVPVSCGHVKTVTNFFVAKDIPFDGLLGRPWQSDNLVSIKEKSNGTYLEFPNPDGKTVSKVLVNQRTPIDRGVESDSESEQGFVMSLQISEEESKKRSRFDSQPSEDDSGVEEPDSAEAHSAKKRRQEGPTLDVICGTYQTSAIVDVNSPISLLNQSTWGLTSVLAKTMKGNVLNNKRGTSHTLLGKVTDLPIMVYTTNHGLVTTTTDAFITDDDSISCLLGTPWTEQNHLEPFVENGEMIVIQREPGKPSLEPSHLLTVGPAKSVAHLRHGNQHIVALIDRDLLLNTMGRRAQRELGLSMLPKSELTAGFQILGVVEGVTFYYGQYSTISQPSSFYVLNDQDAPITLGKPWFTTNHIHAPYTRESEYLSLPPDLRLPPPPSPVPTEIVMTNSIQVEEGRITDSHESVAVKHEGEEDSEASSTSDYEDSEDDLPVAGPSRIKPFPGQIIVSLLCNGRRRNVTIDPSCASNIMSKSVWKDLDIPMSDTPLSHLWIGPSASYDVAGVARNVVISYGFRRKDVSTTFFVVSQERPGILLGEQWLLTEGLCLGPNPGPNEVDLVLSVPQTRRTVRARAVSPSPASSRSQISCGRSHKPPHRMKVDLLDASEFPSSVRTRYNPGKVRELSRSPSPFPNPIPEHERVLDYYSRHLKNISEAARVIGMRLGKGSPLGKMTFQAKEGYDIGDVTAMGIKGKKFYLPECSLSCGAYAHEWFGPAIVQLFPPTPTISRARIHLAREPVKPDIPIPRVFMSSATAPPQLEKHSQQPEVRYPRYFPPYARGVTEISTRRPMIILPAIIHGHVVPFVFDTASEVNLIHRKIWEHITRLSPPGTAIVKPINKAIDSPTICDYGGKVHQALGIAPGVSVTLGHVSTLATFYIIDGTVPTAVLGQPWHYDNSITTESGPLGISFRLNAPNEPRTFDAFYAADDPTQRSVVPFPSAFIGMILARDMGDEDISERFQEMGIDTGDLPQEPDNDAADTQPVETLERYRPLPIQDFQVSTHHALELGEDHPDYDIRPKNVLLAFSGMLNEQPYTGSGVLSMTQAAFTSEAEVDRLERQVKDNPAEELHAEATRIGRWLDIVAADLDELQSIIKGVRLKLDLAQFRRSPLLQPSRQPDPHHAFPTFQTAMS
ncbi:hypothetical protein EUX98_g8340 [Antrodiella citrinella]|uniref:CCHC-type domain-containing protein n=1 Tax=Antrodiella citrinella TaxID=2447956 RepID=A0A4S4MAN0_9APHY|nr:hypothetical protein EUX98_g8340 [Antrodiella citrinella]